MENTTTMSYKWATAAGRKITPDNKRVETPAGYCLLLAFVNGKDAYDGVVVGPFIAWEQDETATN